MLSIFICEDNDIQRSNIEAIIKNYIMIEEFDMELTLSTSNPYDIINFLDENPRVRGIYFLDVDLGYDINGIQLGSQIREKDIDGKIIFITTHSELLILTFTYKVEAMDYILKDDTDIIKKRIYEALKQAQKHYHTETMIEKNRIKLKVGSQIRIFPTEDVVFIETSPIPHKLTLHLTSSTLNFYGKINEMTALSPVMFRSHKSYIINIENIKSIDKTNREITMNNGETCLLSVRQLKKLEITIMNK